MLDAAVDDVHALDPVACRIQCRTDFRQHAAGERAIGHHLVDFLGRDTSDQVAGLVQYARCVGQQYQLFCFQYFGNFASDDVGVDVVGFAVLADPDGA